jgi:hypothetical protein
MSLFDCPCCIVSSSSASSSSSACAAEGSQRQILTHCMPCAADHLLACTYKTSLPIANATARTTRVGNNFQLLPHGHQLLGTPLQRFCEPPSAGAKANQSSRQWCRSKLMTRLFQLLLYFCASATFISPAHAALRSRRLLQPQCSARRSSCWTTDCCCGGGAAKRWTAIAYGRICAGSAAGCAPAAWRVPSPLPSTF